MVEKSQNYGLWPQLFDPFRGFGARIADWLSPASDASSDATAYKISVELPGVEEKDVSLTVEEGTLTITGEKKSSREEKGESWYFTERQFGSFTRSFRLPADADQSAVSADLKAGVLTVTVPRKTRAAETARKVEIRAG
jgi:HSP20 family protein